MKKILFATGNETKAKRFSKGLQEKGIEVITLKDINKEIDVEEKEINDRQAIKIDKLNRKYIFDLINMIYLNQDGSIKIEFKRK